MSQCTVIDAPTHRVRRASSLLIALLLSIAAVMGGGRVSALDMTDILPITDSQSPSVPGEPFSPQDGAFVPDNSFDFSWGVSTDDSGGAITYEFQASQSSNAGEDNVLTGNDEHPLQKSGSLNTVSYHLPDAANGAWYWQVRAFDESGHASAWSNVRVVTIDPTVEVEEGTQPVFPPITPELEPITIDDTPPVTTPQSMVTGNSYSDDNANTPEVLSEKDDRLAQRIVSASAASQEIKPDALRTCALFFGMCWYWSVPGTVLISVGAYAAYRIRSKTA